MIQDIAPNLYNNAYRNELPTNNSFVLYFEEQTVLAANIEDEIHFPLYSEWNNQNSLFTYLFSIDERTYFLAETSPKELPAGYHMESIQLFRTSQPRHIAFAGITAYQLYNWYKSHSFCGRCGDKMLHDYKERMVHCNKCGQMEYPKIAPAVIVAVTDGEKLLMSKYAQGNYKRYALLAGFAEIGETIEETVKREVMEEVGLKVKNIRYYKSQPWSFSDTLLLGFYAELDGDPTITLDEEELSEAVWMDRDKIDVKFDNMSLTNEMIVNFKNRN
jgi:NAD+ diphosphatase